VMRRRDLDLFCRVESPVASNHSAARVKFQPSGDEISALKGVDHLQDRWSWDDDDDDDDDVDDGGFGMGALGDANNSNSYCDPVVTMLDTLYGDTGSSDGSENRWWDRYSSTEYSDAISEWKRNAFKIPPASCTPLNDGDEVIRIDGEDGSGTLLYDLASCRSSASLIRRHQFCPYQLQSEVAQIRVHNNLSTQH